MEHSYFYLKIEPLYQVLAHPPNTLEDCSKGPLSDSNKWRLFERLGKGQLLLAQTLLVITNMKFGANEISVTFIIKLNVGATSTQ